MKLKFDENEQFNGFILESEANKKANGRNVKRSLIHKRKKSCNFYGGQTEGAREFSVI
jgi:hypothetical protein